MVPEPFAETLTLLKCIRRPDGFWYAETKGWVFEDVTLPAVQARAREIFPEAVFVIYFFSSKPKRKKRRRVVGPPKAM